MGIEATSNCDVEPAYSELYTDFMYFKSLNIVSQVLLVLQQYIHNWTYDFWLPVVSVASHLEVYISIPCTRLALWITSGPTIPNYNK